MNGPAWRQAPGARFAFANFPVVGDALQEFWRIRPDIALRSLGAGAGLVNLGSGRRISAPDSDLLWSMPASGALLFASRVVQLERVAHLLYWRGDAARGKIRYVPS